MTSIPMGYASNRGYEKRGKQKRELGMTSIPMRYVENPRYEIQKVGTTSTLMGYVRNQ